MQWWSGCLQSRVGRRAGDESTTRLCCGNVVGGPAPGGLQCEIINEHSLAMCLRCRPRPETLHLTEPASASAWFWMWAAVEAESAQPCGHHGYQLVDLMSLGGAGASQGEEHARMFCSGRATTGFVTSKYRSPEARQRDSRTRSLGNPTDPARAVGPHEAIRADCRMTRLCGPGGFKAAWHWCRGQL